MGLCFRVCGSYYLLPGFSELTQLLWNSPMFMNECSTWSIVHTSLRITTYEYTKICSSIYLLMNIQDASNWLTLQIRLKNKKTKV